MAEDMQEPVPKNNAGESTDLSKKNPEKSHIFQEADKLLRLAEGLQEQCERGERRFTFILVSYSSVVATGFGLGIVTSKYWMQDRSILILQMASIISILYIALLTTSAFNSLGRISRSIRRDKRAYFEIVDMLRELKRHIDQKSYASRLDRAEFLIRLSRLDIGTGLTFSDLLFSRPEVKIRFTNDHRKQRVDSTDITNNKAT